MPQLLQIFRSSPPEVFLGKGVLKICTKFTGEHLCRSVISTKLHSSFIKIALRRRCSPVNLMHIFRTPFLKNTFEGLLLNILLTIRNMHVFVNICLLELLIVFQFIISKNDLVHFYMIFVVSSKCCSITSKQFV